MIADSAIIITASIAAHISIYLFRCFLENTRTHYRVNVPDVLPVVCFKSRQVGNYQIQGFCILAILL